MLSITDIHTAKTVSQSGSIRAAARTLFKTQPAISQSVRRLEEKIGFALFDRSAYRVALTSRGKDFLQQCEVLLSCEARLREYAQVLEKGQESTVHLAYWPMLGGTRLLALLDIANSRYPETGIEVIHAESLDGLDLLVEGKVDISVAPFSSTSNHYQGNDLETRELDRMHFVNVISPALLAGHDPGGVPRDLLSLWNHIVLRSPVSHRSHSFGADRGGRSWAVDNQGLMATLIRNGFGWGMMPEPAVRAELDRGELVELSLPEFGSGINVDIIAARIRGRVPGPVASALWDALGGHDGHTDEP
ncbi:MAG: LysR family transcriptional regulator [Porticoccaceae bacterium]